MMGGMLVIGSTEAMMKMSEADAQKIQETTVKRLRTCHTMN